jgi:hypothetical protein
LPGNKRKEFRGKCFQEPCKSRLRLRPIVSLLRQGFPFPAACQCGGSNSSLSPLAVPAFAGAGSRPRGWRTLS